MAQLENVRSFGRKIPVTLIILQLMNEHLTVITPTYMRDDGCVGMQHIEANFGQCLVLLDGRLQLTARMFTLSNTAAIHNSFNKLQQTSITHSCNSHSWTVMADTQWTSNNIETSQKQLFSDYRPARGRI